MFYLVDEKDEVSIKQAVEMIVEAMGFEHGLEVFILSKDNVLIIIYYYLK